MDFGLVAAVGNALPEMNYTLPYLGTVDVAPYATAMILFVGLSVFFKIIQSIVVARLRAFSRKTTTDVDDVVIDAVSGIRAWVYSYAALYIAVQPFNMPGWLDTTLTLIFLLTVIWQIIEIIVLFADYFARRALEKDEDGDGVPDPNSMMASRMVGLIARIVLWAFGLLFVLSNIGIDVTSLIAGLGIGGIAVAFALQGVLSDLFSSFSIYFDKPFRIGDYIVIGDDDGVVEKIGIKSTRIRTLQGEELVVSNAELTSARIQNFKKMEERRIATQFGVLYETPYEKVKEIPEIITRIFSDHGGARLEWIHLTGFGDSALLFGLTYYVESSNYEQYLDIQHAINLEIMNMFASVGIEFAYPTQTLYVKKTEKS